MIKSDWDIIVAGGGPSGVVAAVAAARGGTQTLLLEASGCLGGMATSGLVACWCPFTDGEKIIYGGLAEHIFRESKAAIPFVEESQIHGHIPFDPEHLKLLLDNLASQYGVTVLFNTQVAEVERENCHIKSITAANKAGLTRFHAKIYIDCTGDADLAHFAGAECYVGNPLDGSTMPASLCFVLSNVDTFAYEHLVGNTWGGFQSSPIWKILDSGNYPEVDSMHLCSNLIGPATVNFNAGHVYCNATDPLEKSRALHEGRRKAFVLHRALKDCSPEAFGNSFLASTAVSLGVRETRRINGEYELTLNDYLARRSFDDEIARNCYFLDIHQGKSFQQQCLTYKGWKKFIDDNQIHDERKYQKGESHGIPYRSLIPKGFNNLLVAGRSISCDRHVQSSIRVMPVCMSTGEAAGVAAFLAAGMPSPDSRGVDIHELRSILRKYNCVLP